MAGLLDWLKTPEGQGLLAAGFGAAASARRGQPWNTMGRGGLAGLAGYSQAIDRQSQEAERAELMKDREVNRDFRQAQMDKLYAEQAREVAQRKWREGLPGVMQQTQTQYGAGEEGPTMTPGDPQALQNYLRMPDSPFADKLLEQQLFPKADDFKVVGNSLVRISNGGVQEAFRTPDKPEAAPSSVREYEYAKGQGYQGTYEQFQKDMKKAGASSVTVNATKPFINEFAGGMGKAMSDARTNAQGALSTISTVNRLNDALDAGVMAGPGTSFRQFGLQVGSMLGVAGKDAQEKLINTRQAIQSLAQLELDAAQQMKGQGQITEAERSIIRRAASGDIDSMTAGELRLLGGVLDRTARSKIEAYNSQVEPLMSAPETAGIAPFLRVTPPEGIQRKPTPTTPMAAPQKGQVVDGYRFKGGNPSDPKNWEQTR
jgi:hypothetical protein